MFHRINGDSTSLEGGCNILEIANGEYLAVTASVILGQTNWRLKFYEVRKDSVVEKYELDLDSNWANLGWFGSAFRDGNFVVIGDAYVKTDDADPGILSFDFDSWLLNYYKAIERDSINTFSQGKKTPEGNYIFTGVTHEHDTDGDFYLVKTDPLGNVIWERTFGTEYAENAFSVNNTPDQGFIILGVSEGYGNQIGYERQALLIKTDSNGEQEWQQTWGRDLSETAWNIETTPDGGYVACGRITAGDQWTPQSHGYIRKMDSQGKFEWDVEFEEDDEYGYPPAFIMSQVLKNGNIVAVGGGYRVIKEGEIVQGTPWMVIIGSDGELLMSRSYNSFLEGDTSSQAKMTEAVFRDIRPTMDGGFIAGGTYFPGVGDTGNQDLFIVKLDSAGCEYPGCQPPLAINELDYPKLNFEQMHIWPNPAYDVLNIELAGVEGADFTLIDATGRVIMVPINNNQLDISHLESGCYTLVARLANGVRFAKFVKSSM